MWAALAKSAKEIHLRTDDTFHRPGGLQSGPVDIILPVGSAITISKNPDGGYYLWREFIWGIEEDCVGEIIHIYSNQ